MSLELTYNKPMQPCMENNRTTNSALTQSDNASLKVRAGSRAIMTYEEKLEFLKKSCVGGLLGISNLESSK